jgi:hypothetical protein
VDARGHAPRRLRPLRVLDGPHHGLLQGAPAQRQALLRHLLRRRGGLLHLLGISEPSQCSYLLEARAKAACGTTGDPFDPGQDSGGQRFGYVVLGAFLTVGLSFTYSFGDNRGWWNGIKSRIPSVNIPFIGAF